MYDDFYESYEPSKYDLMIEELKETLRNSVKQEYIDRINKLEEENKALQEIKKNFESIKTDYERKSQECEWEKEKVLQNAVKEAKETRLKELMADVQREYWQVGNDYLEQPKCDKCDENRRIHYVTPRGRDAVEECECATKKSIFVPKSKIIYEIALRNGVLKSWFTAQKSNDDDDYYISKDYLGHRERVSEDADVSTLNKENLYIYYFETREKCQEFCNLLNTETRES